MASAASSPPISSGLARARFWFVLILFLVLLALVHGGAWLLAWRDGAEQASACPGVIYYRVVLSIWAAILLLTPALCFHVFSRSRAANTYWRFFWTFAYLAFLVHLYWAIFGTFGGDLGAMFHSSEGLAPNRCRVIENPGPDLVLAAWWGVDVILA